MKPASFEPRLERSENVVGCARTRRLGRFGWLARVAVAAVALGALAPGQALAQGVTKESMAALAAGDKATRAKDWPAAITAYSAAKAADPSLAALDGLANALYSKGDAPAAYDAYEQLIRAHVSKLKKDHRTKVEARLKELGEKTGTLTVESEAGAEVVVDGASRGALPLARSPRFGVGEHKVEVRKAGFTPFTSTVQIAANAGATVVAKLVAISEKGTLRVHEAEGRTVHVFVDGIDMGPAPWEGDVAAGPHEVAAKGDRLKSPTEKVQIEKGSRRDVEVRAASTAARFKVTVDGSPTAKITIDGVEVGEGMYTGELPAGTHKLVITREGYQRFEEEVVLAEKETSSRTVVLTLSSVVKTGGDDKGPRKLEGFYGGFGVMGVMLPAGNGSDVQQSCKNKSQGITGCTGGGAGIGGGLFFFAGHHWDPVGLELLLGGSYDQQRATVTYGPSNLGVGGGFGPDPARTEDFFIGRAGGFLLGRTRLSFQTQKLRGSFAVGVGASYRVSFLARDTTGPDPLRDAYATDGAGSLSPVLNLDGSVALRLTERLSIPLGLMMLAESPSAKLFGDQVPRSPPDLNRQLAPGVGLTTPSYALASGPQVYLGVYLGLTFGP
ncbi:MAG: PEGA domain-containing protein [Myxococcales bacterium]|nr:PEGA domain-containing protein [Myxococcales bacterium]